jgi:hypothetical protein
VSEFFIWVRLNISTLRAAIRALREQATLRRYTSKLEDNKARGDEQLEQSAKSNKQADELGEELKRGQQDDPRDKKT